MKLKEIKDNKDFERILRNKINELVFEENKFYKLYVTYNKANQNLGENRQNQLFVLYLPNELDVLHEIIWQSWGMSDLFFLDDDVEIYFTLETITKSEPIQNLDDLENMDLTGKNKLNKLIKLINEEIEEHYCDRSDCYSYLVNYETFLDKLDEIIKEVD